MLYLYKSVKVTAKFSNSLALIEMPKHENRHCLGCSNKQECGVRSDQGIYTLGLIGVWFWENYQAQPVSPNPEDFKFVGLLGSKHQEPPGMDSTD